jgi:exodeoxyribonuclease-3
MGCLGSEDKRVKIATFNINNVNRRLPNLLAWLEAAKPDVVCLQELKAADAAFPAAPIRDAGYGAVWQGQASWNGVAILARHAEPVVTRRRQPGDVSDTQSRYIEAAVEGILIGCIYLPNGNPQPGPKFAYKLAWFERLKAHAAELHATGLPVILAGDYNVVPTNADIYPSKSWAKDALLQPASRAAFRQLLEQGWTDAIRARHPTATLYTFGTTSATAGYSCSDLNRNRRSEKQRRYDLCLLNHLGGAQGRGAANQIASACRGANPLF